MITALSLGSYFKPAARRLGNSLTTVNAGKVIRYAVIKEMSLAPDHMPISKSHYFSTNYSPS